MSEAELLRLAQSGDQAGLVHALEIETSKTHHVTDRGLPMSESQKLLDEALWYARRGDLDEARYRLSMVEDHFEDDEDDWEDDE